MTSPSSIPTSILLLGAGELGSAVLSQLAKHPALSGTHFTVALRPSTVANPASARLASLRSLVPPGSDLSFTGLDLAAADAADALKRAIRAAEAEVVIACTGYAAGAGTQLLVANAVLESGVARRYFPWQWGCDYDVIGPGYAGGLMAEHCAVRDLLRERAGAAGVEWVVVSAGIFMSFVFEEWVGVVEGLGGALRKGSLEGLEGGVTVRGFGGWETRLTLTDVEDIGKVTADLVVQPVEERNDRGGSVVFVSGQTVRYQELADVVEKVLGAGVQVKRELWTTEYLEGEQEQNPEDPLKKYRLMFGKKEGINWDKEKTINAQRGIETMGVEEWLRGKLGR